MDFGIKGKVALVAGGGRGCGRAIAEELAREGVRVAITGRQRQIMERTASEIRTQGLQALPLVGDMEDKITVRSWMEQVRAAYGDPEIVVINPPGPPIRSHGFDATTDEEFAASVNPWTLPIVHLLREALPAMKARQWGRVVNIGSEAMKVPHTDPMYFANMRVAAAAMMKTLSHEFGRYNITFNTIATGPFLTDLSRDYMTDAGAYGEQEMLNKTTMGRWGRPEEMGAVVAFLCSTRASWLTGETIRVDGGYGHSLF